MTNEENATAAGEQVATQQTATPTPGVIEGSSENGTTAPTTEGQKASTEGQKPERDEKGLSLRASLKAAMQEAKETEKGDKAAPSVAPRKRKEVVFNKEPSSEQTSKTTSRYEAPASFTPEEREVFASLAPEIQGRILKINESLVEKHKTLQRREEQVRWAEQIVQEAQPLIEKFGETMSPYQAIVKALKLRNDLETGEPEAMAAAYLQRKGRPVPKELLERAQPSAGSAAESDLRKKVEELENRFKREELTRSAELHLTAWNSFTSQKNEAGANRYPDVNDTESGIQLATKIGQLVSGNTALSQEFIANIRSRNPHAGPIELLDAAYRYYGGRIDDSKPAQNTRKQPSTEEHLKRSAIAAASKPGSGGISSDRVVKYKSTRDALAAAMRSLSDS